jgi:hypothetical protein
LSRDGDTSDPARAAGEGREGEGVVSPRSEAQPSEVRPGPPPLRPFGLRLHHDGRWSHEGEPIRNRRLREHFDRSVRWLPEERKYVVTLQHFRGEIEVEEAAFFVRSFDAASGRVALSDGSEEPLEPGSLSLSPIDGALLCRVKRVLAPEGLLARFAHGAHATLMQAVQEEGGRLVLRLAGRAAPVPDLGL